MEAEEIGPMERSSNESQEERIVNRMLRKEVFGRILIRIAHPPSF